MHTISKIFICTIGMMGTGFVHAAAPVSKKELVASIVGDLNNLHGLLAAMIASPKDALGKHLERFDAASLSKFKNAIGECHFSAEFVYGEYNKLYPVGVCKPLNKQFVQVQHKNAHESHHGLPASEAVIVRVTKPQGGAAQAQTEKPLPIMTHFEDGTTIGTATQNLMATSPKFKMGIEIGSLSNKLVGMTDDKQRLGAYKPLARKIITPEDSTLRQFQNASQQKLEKFVDFLRVLIDGSKSLLDFYLKFHVGTIVANVGEAAQEMSEEQLKPLHALLTQLAK